MSGLLNALLEKIGLRQNEELDVADPATGLTLRQKELVRSTWALVMPDIRTVSVEVLTTLFETFPQHYPLFTSFAGLEVADLKNSKKFTAHASTVFHALASLVDALDDTEVLIQLCEKVGKAHISRKVPPGAFDDLKAIALKVLSAKLGNKLSPAAAEAWDKTLTVAFSLIKKELSEDQE